MYVSINVMSCLPLEHTEVSKVFTSLAKHQILQMVQM